MQRSTAIKLAAVAGVAVAAILGARPLAVRALGAAIPRVKAAIAERYGVSVDAEDVSLEWDWLWPVFEFRSLSLKRPDGTMSIRLGRARARVGLEQTIRSRAISVSTVELELVEATISDTKPTSAPFVTQWDRVRLDPSSESVVFEASSADVALKGQYQFEGRKAAVVLVLRGDVAKVLSRLPSGVIPAKTDRWLRQALTSGDISGATVSWNERGLKIDAPVKSLSFKFSNRWPALTDADGVVGIELSPDKSALTARLARATFAGASLSECLGEVPELTSSNAILSLRCGVKGSGQVLRAFLDQGPVSSTTKPILELVNPGDARDMELSLAVPIEKGDVAGKITIRDADIEVVRPKLAATHVSGVIEFKGQFLELKDIKATVFGSPWEISGNKKSLLIQGTVPLQDLAELLGAPRMLDLASGTLRGTARLQFIDWDLPARRLEVALDAPMEGILLKAPEPFGSLKQGELTARAVMRGEFLESLGAELRGNPEGPLVSFQWGGRAKKISAKVELATLDLGEWQKYLEGMRGGGADSTPFDLSVDLKTKTLKWRDLEFAEVLATIKTSQAGSTVNVQSIELLGEMKFGSPYSQGSAVGRFERVILPRWPKGDGVVTTESDRLKSAWRIAEVPGIDLSVGRLRVGDQLYGSVEILAKKTGARIQLEKLKVAGPELEVSSAKGLWADDKTEVDLLWKFKDTTFPTRFDSMTGVGLKLGELRTTWSWSGGPDQFAIKRLSGRVEGTVREGALLGMSSGAASTFNFLSYADDDAAAKRLRFYKARLALGIKDGTMTVERFTALFGSVYVRLQGQAFGHTEKLALEAGVTPSVEDLPADGSEPKNLLSHRYKIGGTWSAPEVSLKIF